MAKILVVDDEAEVRNAVDLMLKLEGHSVLYMQKMVYRR